MPTAPARTPPAHRARVRRWLQVHWPMARALPGPAPALLEPLALYMTETDAAGRLMLTDGPAAIARRMLALGLEPSDPPAVDRAIATLRAAGLLEVEAYATDQGKRRWRRWLRWHGRGADAVVRPIAFARRHRDPLTGRLRERA